LHIRSPLTNPIFTLGRICKRVITQQDTAHMHFGLVIFVERMDQLILVQATISYKKMFIVSTTEPIDTLYTIYVPLLDIYTSS
jgi:hypothetical protein